MVIESIKRPAVADAGRPMTHHRLAALGGGSILMAWLGWSLIIAAIAVWGLGALGWIDEVREFLRAGAGPRNGVGRRRP